MFMLQQIKLIIFFSILTAISAVYIWQKVRIADLEVKVSQLEQSNQRLTDNQQTLEEIIKNNKEQFDKLQLEAEAGAARMTELTRRNNELTRMRDNYMKIFSDHNLARLARAKPGLIETRINRATREVFKEVEKDSREVQDAETN